MNSNSAPSLLFFLGPPGSGKGTQSILLADRLHLLRIDMGGLLRERFRRALPDESVEIEDVRYFVKDQQQRYDEGKLVDSPFVARVLQDRLQELAEEGKGVVIDGYPRAVDQIEPILPSLLEVFGIENIRLLVLEIGEEESIRRNAHRRMCELMGHPILFSEETARLTKCPLDGSLLVKRGDDDPEILRVRLREMGEKQIRPVAEFLEQKDIKVHHINGSRSVADVFADVLESAQ